LQGFSHTSNLMMLMKKSKAKQPPKTKQWSKAVTEHSHALQLKEGIFTWNDPEKIAQSLWRSALQSKERKSTPYQSAISMLNFYINRAGKNLKHAQKNIWLQAKKLLQKIAQSHPE